MDDTINGIMARLGVMIKGVGSRFKFQFAHFPELSQKLVCLWRRWCKKLSDMGKIYTICMHSKKYLVFYVVPNMCI